MIPILITGGNLEARLAKARSLIIENCKFIENCKLKIENFESHPDILIVQPEPSIKIKQIRGLQIFLSRKPFQAKIKAVILPQAEKMTIPAQNSFLKTLEEPPAHSLIVLSCPVKDQLLATIVSRCQVINLVFEEKEKIDLSLITNHYSLFTKLINSSPGRRLLLIEPYTKNRKEAVKFCKEMIICLRQELLDKKKFLNPSITNHQALITNLKSFQATLNLLKVNVNVKLTLDNLVLNLLKM